MSNRALGVLLAAAVVGLAASALTGAQQKPGGGAGQAPGRVLPQRGRELAVAVSGVLSPPRCSRPAMPTRTERSHAPS